MKKKEIREKSTIQISFNSNPKNIAFYKYINIDSSPFNNSFDNTFCIFESVNKIYYLIYSRIFYTIKIYDLINQKTISEIKKAHNKEITNFRHILDSLNKRDLILSISDKDNNLKVWDIKNFVCILNLMNANKEGSLNSACFLKEKNKIYILTSNSFDNYRGINYEPIKVFDLTGKKLKEINESNLETYLVDKYYNEKTNKNYVISGNICFCRSYDFAKNKIYQKYNDKGSEFFGHTSLVVYPDEKITKLIESSIGGFLRIWDFDTGKLLNRINMNQKVYGICLWNNNYLFIGCENYAMELIDLNKGKSVKTLLTSMKAKGEKTIRKIIHPIFGECLISQSQNEQINFWIDKKLCI